MKYVAIGIHGSFFQAVMDPFVGEPACIFANGTGIGDPTIFERIELDESRVGFRQLVGGYLSVQSVGNLAFLGISQQFGDDEVFTEVWWADDRVSLMGSNGLFVCAESGGGSLVVVNRAEAGPWEKFFYTQPPVELIPLQPQRAEPVGDVAEATTSMQMPRQVDVTDDVASVETTLQRPHS